MKKIIAWILLAAMMLSLFVGCGKAADPTQPSEIPDIPTEAASGENNAADVIAYLEVIYKDSGAKTPGNFNRFGIVRIAGVPYEVVWTADVSEDLVKVVVNDDGTVTVDVNEECTQDTNYVLTATCTDDNGNTASTSWEYLLPGVDYEGMKAIVDQAYALDKGAVLDGEHTLMGEIISVDTAWSDQYKNITVSISVKDREDKPIMCYRLKGDGAQDLMVGDTITVFGILKNYNGTIEFDAGCQLVAVIKGDGVAIEAPTDPLEIMKEAYALRIGMSLPYEVTLTGVVTSIDTAYSEQYKNISVNMTVDGAPDYEILCYRLKGTDAETLNANDIISVTGKIKNYAGTIEFDAGCELNSVIQKEPPTMPKNQQCVVDSAYALKRGKSLPYVATLTGKVVSIDSPFSDKYDNITITIVVDGRENKPIKCYRLSGSGMRTLEVGDIVTVVGNIKHYYDKTTKVSEIEFDQGCKILNTWKSFNYGPLNEGAEYLMFVDKTGSKLYFNGTMSSYYLATSNDKNESAIIYADRTNQGVLFYFMDGETPTYISAVASGKYINIKLTDSAASYFTYNTEIGAYTTKVNDKELFMGSNGTYKTLSLYTIDKIKDSNYQPVQFVTNDPPADTALSVADAIALGSTKAHNTYTEGKYYVTGKITEIYNTTYGNMKIADSDGNILTIYGTWSADGNTRFDKLVTPPAVGDTVTLYGIIGQYNGTPQLKNGWLRAEGEDIPETPDVPTDEPAADSTLSIADAIALGVSKEHNTYTTGKYYVTGEITEIYNTTYGNMRIKDAAGNILTVYGTYNEDGTVRFDKLDVQPVVGETITVYGIIGQYNGTAQVKNGWIIPAKEGDPAANTKLSISAAIALGSSKEHNTYTEGKYYVTGEITEIYNTTYGNMRIKDAAGNILTVYGTYDADGTNRYDAMEVKPVAGDTVTVYGIIGQYNGTPQVKNGWITEHVPAGDSGETEKPETPADPEADSKLTVAEAIALGTSKEHNTYTSGKYYITGEITEVYNTTYGNMRIKDAAGNILTVYGTYDADGTNRYDAMEVKPVAGDTVTVYGIIGQYNGTPQVKNGWITEHIPAGDSGETEEPEAPTEPETPTEPEAPAVAAATISFANTANRTSFSTEEQVWAQNGITVTNSKGASTSDVAGYSDPARFYMGSSLTISYSGMTKMVITCGGQAKYVNGLTDSLTALGIPYTVNGMEVTVTVSNTLHIESLAAQTRIASIAVYTA